MPVAQVVGTGPRNVVLVHGTPSDASVWSRVIERAPPGLRVVLVDLPDHGTAPDEPSLELGPFLDDLEDVVRGLGSGPTTLIGHSFGAYLVARLLPALDDRVDRAVLVAGLARLADDFVASREALASDIEDGRFDRAALGDLALDIWLGRRHRAPDHEQVIRAMLDRTPTPRLLRSLRRLRAMAAPEARLAPYRTKAVVLHGQDDAAVPLELAQEVAELGACAELVVLDTDSHFLPLTHPDQILAAAFAE